MGPRFRRRRRVRRIPGWALTIAVGLVLAAGCVSLLELRLRPMVITLAQAQAQNLVTSVVEQAFSREMNAQPDAYRQLVDIQRDETGAITALSADMPVLNQLRTTLTADVLQALQSADVSQIQVPLGSLVDLDLLWGLGPTVKVYSMTVGTVEGEFESEFSSAGVNQTVHRIILTLKVPLTLMLPGGAAETVCETQLCVAETVIVGQVPESYLQWGGQ